MKCSECKYWYEDSEFSDDVGQLRQCRRNPPVVMHEMVYPNGSSGEYFHPTIGMWPFTRPNNGCGEFDAKNPVVGYFKGKPFYGNEFLPVDQQGNPICTCTTTEKCAMHVDDEPRETPVPPTFETTHSVVHGATDDLLNILKSES